MSETIVPAKGAEADLISESLYRQFLESLGIDMNDSSLVDTPGRVVRMYRELLSYEDFEPTSFDNDGQYDSLVVVTDVPFYSLCEHHVIPFYGTATVAYLPNGKVIGLSKLARFVEKHARRLQVQERMTRGIAQDVQDVTHAKAVGVIVEARHMCAEMRGVRKPGMLTVTSTMLGELRTNASLKEELMSAIRHRDGR